MSRLVLPRRRELLKGLSTLMLPLLGSLGCRPDPEEERLGRASLRADSSPKRFIFVYTPNGSYDPPAADYPSYWSVLSPLAHKISFATGLNMSVADQGPGEPHQSGMAMLTGRSLNKGSFVGGDGQHAGWASGISIDQEIARHIGQTTPRGALNLGVQSTNYGGTEVRTILSYLGSDLPVANETNPWALWSSLFEGLNLDPDGSALRLLRRKSVLDHTGKRFDAIRNRVSSEDRDKLDRHLTSLRDVESRLEGPSVIGGSCQIPSAGGVPKDVDAFLADPANFPTIGRLHTDLLVMALACDLTRVATLQWSAAINNRPYPWLTYEGSPITDDEHSLSHRPDSDLAAWGKLATIRKWNLEELLYLLESLDSVPEGEGTLLDNTVVVLSSEIVRGNTHSHLGQHFLLAGGAGGALKTGQFLDFQGQRSHNDLLTTLLIAMGIEAKAFGDPAACQGPLTELLV